MASRRRRALRSSGTLPRRAPSRRRSSRRPVTAGDAGPEVTVSALAWRKRGLAFSPRGAPEWMSSHASLPLGLRLADGRHRVYFASRDGDNRSHVAWVELDLDRPSEGI